MKVEITRTDFQGLKETINKIGYENVLEIIPEHIYDGTLFIIIYKSEVASDVYS